MIISSDKYIKSIPDNMNEYIFDTLLELRDVHFPKASFFPLSPALILLILLFLILLFRFIWKKFLCYQGRVGIAKKITLIKLDSLTKKHQNDENISAFASEISILLKRISIVCFGKKEVVKLYGKEWSQFIFRKIGLDNPDEEIDFLIANALYLPPKKDDKTSYYISKLNVFVKKWIEQI